MAPSMVFTVLKFVVDYSSGCIMIFRDLRGREQKIKITHTSPSRGKAVRPI